MPNSTKKGFVLNDLLAGIIVSLVALPLCLGVALASDAPAISGVLAGIIGGILVGTISRSQTSVSGPAAGLTAVVAAQIAALGSFEAFLLAVFIAGIIQIALGLMKAGAFAAFVPSSVIHGLLAAIGVILILKQFPHLVGHDTDPEGEMSFQQPDNENTFTELVATFSDLHYGALVVGLGSLALLYFWDWCKPLKKTGVPAPLIVVLLGVGANMLFARMGTGWLIGSKHLVELPVAERFNQLGSFITMANFSHWLNPTVYTAAITIALVASLETLLNLEAVDKIDPELRESPPNRELIAQGIGNMTAGLIGAIPVTSVIVRSSVNIRAGVKTKLSTIFHGLLLLSFLTLIPSAINKVPLACLAAVLFHTGFKLASPALFKRMWREGRYQFLPFIITLSAIVLTDLLSGILIGLVVAAGFILNSNLRKPIRKIAEKHLDGEVLHIELPNQVSFLNRASLSHTLSTAPRGAHILMDATRSDFIDPDVLSLIRDFKERMGPAHGVQVSLRGFRDKYQINDEIQFVDYSTREFQEALTAPKVLQLLKDGNERFRSGHRIERDLGRLLDGSAKGQHPLAVILSCIDSRNPAEMVFDLSLGDMFSVRVAGNIISRKVLGSMEYGAAVAGAKVIVVMGHTSCGAVTASVNLAGGSQSAADATGCQHLEPIVTEIQRSIDQPTLQRLKSVSESEHADLVNEVSRFNVLRTVNEIVSQSTTISKCIKEDRLAIIGAMYNVSTGSVDFFEDEALGLKPEDEPSAEFRD